MAVPASFHQVRFKKNLHMVRQGGLTDVEMLKDFAGAQFSLAEHHQGLQASGIGKCFYGIQDDGFFGFQEQASCRNLYRFLSIL